MLVASSNGLTSHQAHPSEAGQATFLLQHQEKLGGNRFIDKIRLWIPDGTSLPYLLFYVNPTPAGSGSAADAILRAPSPEAERVANPSARNTN